MSKHPKQITTAEAALDDDMRSRIIKYSITMGIRTACFVAAYFAFDASATVLMWIFVAGAVLLPYPAVIFANAGRERSRNDASALIDEAPRLELPPARGATIPSDLADETTESTGGSETTIIPGDVVDDDSAAADEHTSPDPTSPPEPAPGSGSDPDRE
ncbi:DUF3099 domain-containing protein [Brevibacterium sp.]|uniref:DUF3099 domain-containing protein n=1 Tax=Brevibacterium sp. TaxID=1701 RepID=UPI0028123C92|nr:DUF3099 domain-containing protein [Brevibacterium sp.]